jgi:ABC-2 type transport system permease protein
MKNIWTIAWKDFRTYFTSPIAYVIISGFLLIMGWMFFNSMQYFHMHTLQYSQYNAGKGVSLAEGIIKPLYGNMNVILLFLMPFITMRLLAEERKLQTLELLFTAPVRMSEIVLGKFFSAFLLLCVMMAFTLAYPLILVLIGNPEIGPLCSSVLGTLLLGACYLANGLFFSSMTDNQLVAGAMTFASGLFFWLVNWAANSAGPVWSEVLQYLSLIGHFNAFGQGIINSSDVIYYVSFIFMGLFLTHRVLDSTRWR